MTPTIHIIDGSYAKRPLDHVKPSDRWIMFKAKDSESWISLSGIHERAQDAISTRQPVETAESPPTKRNRRRKP